MMMSRRLHSSPALFATVSGTFSRQSASAHLLNLLAPLPALLLLALVFWTSSSATVVAEATATPLSPTPQAVGYNNWPGGHTPGSMGACASDGSGYMWIFPFQTASHILRVAHDGSMTAYNGYPASAGGTNRFLDAVHDGSDYIWAAPYDANGIVRVTVADGTMIEHNAWPGAVSFGNTAHRFGGIALVGTDIWLSQGMCNMIIQMATATGSMVGHTGWPSGFTGGTGTAQCTIGFCYDGKAHLWNAPYSSVSNMVLRIDPSDGSMVGYGTFPGSVNLGSTSQFTTVTDSFDGTSIWLAPVGADSAVSVAVASGAMTGYNSWPHAFSPGTLRFIRGAYDGSYLYLSPRDANMVVKIDPSTGAMNGYGVWPTAGGFVLPGSNAFLGACFDAATASLWLVSWNADRIIRFKGDQEAVQCGTSITPTGPTSPAPMDTTPAAVGYNTWPVGLTKTNKAFHSGLHDGSYLWMCPWDVAEGFVRVSENGDMTNFNTGWPGGLVQSTARFQSCVYDGSANIYAIPYNANGIVRLTTADGSMALHNSWPGASPGGPFIGASYVDGYVWAVDTTSTWVVRMATSDGSMVGYNSWPSGNGGRHGGMVFDGSNIWMGGWNSATMNVKISTTTGTMQGYLYSSTLPAGVNYGGTYKFQASTFDGVSVWFCRMSDNAAISVNTLTDVISKWDNWPTGYAPGSVASGSGVWDGRYIYWSPNDANFVVRLDPSTGVMINYGGWPAGTNLGAGESFKGIVFDGHSLWAIPMNCDRIVRFLSARLQVSDSFSPQLPRSVSSVQPFEGRRMVTQSYTINPTGFTCTSGCFWGTSLVGDYVWLTPKLGTNTIIVKTHKVTGAMTTYSTWPAGLLHASSSVNNFIGSAYDKTRGVLWLTPNQATYAASIDVRTGAVTSCGSWPAGFTTGLSFLGSFMERDHFWITPHTALSVVRFDMNNCGANHAHFTLLGGYSGFGAGAVFDGVQYGFSIPHSGSHVLKIDVYSGVMVGYNTWPGSFSPGSIKFLGAAFDGQNLWMPPSDSNMVVKMDKDTGTTTGYNSWPSSYVAASVKKFAGASYDGKYVWAPPRDANMMLRIDPSTGDMAGFPQLPSGFSTYGLALDFDTNSMWFVNIAATTLVRATFPTLTQTVSQVCSETDCYVQYGTALSSLGTFPGGVTCICYPELEHFSGSILLDTITTLEVALFPRLKTLTGYVNVKGNPVLGTLDLSSITSVGSYINIATNPLLASLGSASPVFGTLTSLGSYVKISNTLVPGDFDFSQITTPLTATLTIRGNPFMTSLDLRNVPSIGGSIYVQTNAALHTLEISSVTSIAGYIILTGCPLTSLGTVHPMFGGLTTLGSYIRISNTQLSGAFDFSQISGPMPSTLIITNNAGLTSVDVRNIASVSGGVFVQSNPLLHTIDLSNLASTGASYFYISACPLLTSVGAPALANLRSVGGHYLKITGTALPVLDFANLVFVSTYVQIQSNSALHTLNFPHLESVGTDTFTVASNPLLTTLNVCKLTTHGGISIAGYGSPFACSALHPSLHPACAPAGCPTPTPTLTPTRSSICSENDCHVDYSTTLSTLGTLPGGVKCICYPELIHFTGGISVTSIATLEIALFPRLETIGGAFMLHMNPLLELVDVSHVSSIGGDVLIAGNPLLSSLGSTAFGTLVSVGGSVKIIGTALPLLNIILTSVNVDLYINSNTALPSVDLSSVTSVSGILEIYSNPILASVDLSNLVSSGNNLYVASNPLLVTCDLSSLTTVSTGYLNINTNPLLTSVGAPALGTVATVGGYVKIIGTALPLLNIILTSVNGDLYINSNTALPSVDLSSVTSVSGILQIYSNTILTSVSLIQVTAITGALYVASNTLLQTFDVNALTSVGTYLNVVSNPVLSSIGTSAFGNLVSVGTYIRFQHSTVPVLDFSQLTSIGGAVSLSGHSVLTSVTLSNIVSVTGALSVSANPLLEIIRLSRLESVSAALTVQTNPALTTLELCQLTSHGGFTLSGYGSPFACGIRHPGVHASCAANMGCTATASSSLTPTSTASETVTATYSSTQTHQLTPTGGWPAPPTSTGTPSAPELPTPTATAPSTATASAPLPDPPSPVPVSPTAPASTFTVTSMTWSGDIVSTSSSSVFRPDDVRTATITVQVAKHITTGSESFIVNCSTNTTERVLSLVTAPSVLVSQTSTGLAGALLPTAAGSFSLSIHMLVVSQTNPATTIECSASESSSTSNTVLSWSNLTVKMNCTTETPTNAASLWQTSPTLETLQHDTSGALNVSLTGERLANRRVLIGPYMVKVSTASTGRTSTAIASLPPAVTCGQLLSSSELVGDTSSAADLALISHRMSQDATLTSKIQGLCSGKASSFVLAANLFHWDVMMRPCVSAYTTSSVPPFRWAPALQAELRLRIVVTNRRAAASSASSVTLEAGDPTPTPARLSFTLRDVNTGATLSPSELGLLTAPATTVASYDASLSPTISLINTSATAVDLEVSAPAYQQGSRILHLQHTWGPRSFSTSMTIPVFRPSLSVSSEQVDRWIAVFRISTTDSWGTARDVTLNISSQAAIRFTISSNSTYCSTSNDLLECVIPQVAAGTTMEIFVNASSTVVKYNFNGAAVLRYSLAAANGNSTLSGKLVLKPQSTGSTTDNAATNSPATRGNSNNNRGVFGQGDGVGRCIDAFVFASLGSIGLVLGVVLFAALALTQKKKEKNGSDDEWQRSTWNAVPVWRSLALQHAYCIIPCHSQCALNHTLPLVLHVFTLMMLCAAISTSFLSSDVSAIAVTAGMSIFLAVGVKPVITSAFYFRFTWPEQQLADLLAATQRRRDLTMASPSKISIHSSSGRSDDSPGKLEDAFTSQAGGKEHKAHMEKSLVALENVELDETEEEEEEDNLGVELENDEFDNIHGSKPEKHVERASTSDEQDDALDDWSDLEDDVVHEKQAEEGGEKEEKRSSNNNKKNTKKKMVLPLLEGKENEAGVGKEVSPEITVGRTLGRLAGTRGKDIQFEEEEENRVDLHDEEQHAEEEEEDTSSLWNLKMIVRPHRMRGHLVVCTFLAIVGIITLSVLLSIQTSARCSTFETSFVVALLVDFVLIQPLVLLCTYLYRWMTSKEDDEIWSELHPRDGEERPL